MLRFGFHLCLIGFLTLLTQLGGLAWLIALLFNRRLTAFLIAYSALNFSAIAAAPHFGRVALPCVQGDILKVRSVAFCVLNRQYVVPELRNVLEDMASALASEYPGTKTFVLDASFPFFDGFPLLPHLSHDDGRKADIAFYYKDASGYLPGKTKSPIGYFAFETGPTTCPTTWLSLRWNAGPLQKLWPDWRLEIERTRFVMQSLARDPRVGKMFIETHLKTRLQLTDGKLRFQGCRAARHDDHIHVQL